MPSQPSGLGVDTDLLEAALERLHARRSGPAEATPTRQEDVYPVALRHFDRQERLLRRQSEVSRELIARMRGDAQVAAQRVVVLRGAAGGRVGGRIVLANETEARARFTFRPAFDLPVELRPAVLEVEPGARGRVDVRIDLAGAPFAPGEAHGLLLDVLVGDVVRIKVWLDLLLDPDGP